MKIVAKTIKGSEFIYSKRSAYHVNKKHADLIAESLNRCRYGLKENETWHVYEIDRYDDAYAWAEVQSFYFTKNGTLKCKSSY